MITGQIKHFGLCPIVSSAALLALCGDKDKTDNEPSLRRIPGAKRVRPMLRAAARSIGVRSMCVWQSGSAFRQNKPRARSDFGSCATNSPFTRGASA